MRSSARKATMVGRRSSSRSQSRAASASSLETRRATRWRSSPSHGATTAGIEHRIDALISQMTLEEKLEQIQLLPDFLVTEDEVRDGLGSVLSVTDPRGSASSSRWRSRTPASGSRSCSPSTPSTASARPSRSRSARPRASTLRWPFADARFGARESAAVGLKQTYAPMVDVSHEPRWGRISEGGGEDPYLNAVLAAARVKGTQGI